MSALRCGRMMPPEGRGGGRFAGRVGVCAVGASLTLTRRGPDTKWTARGPGAREALQAPACRAERNSDRAGARPLVGGSWLDIWSAAEARPERSDGRTAKPSEIRERGRRRPRTPEPERESRRTEPKPNKRKRARGRATERREPAPFPVFGNARFL